MELKIKPIFLGKTNNFKKNQIINNYYCLYFHNGKSFLYAKENKSFIEYLINKSNSAEKEKITRLLNSEKFYEFLNEIPNLKNYSKFLEIHYLKDLNLINKINDCFQDWLIGTLNQKIKALDKIKKELKQEIVINYLSKLKTEQPKLRELKRTEPKKRKLRRISSKAK